VNVSRFVLAERTRSGAVPLWAAALALAVAVGACSGGEGAGATTATVPASRLPQAKLDRADTAGDALLAWAPAGADVILEIDLARVRDNPVVGSLYAAATAGATGPSPVALDYDVMRKADAVVVCGYRVGTAASQSLVFLRGRDAPDPGPRGVRLDDRTIALAPPPLLRRLEAARAGQEDPVAADEPFMRLRDAAMPEEAAAAALRLTARLGFDARIGLASVLSLDTVPASVSLWGDVIDDLALVALLGGDGEVGGDELAAAVTGWRAELAAAPRVRELLLAHVVRGVEVQGRGDLARVVFILGPDTLELVARRLERRLAVR